MSGSLPISVVVPAHNSAGTLARALQSVARQRPAAPAELIVVDDASSDATAAIAEEHGATVIRRAVNGGAAAARNDGFAAATQPWIALLDADDEWLEHHLAQLWPHRADHVLLACAALSVGADPAEDRLHCVVPRRRVVLRDPARLVFPGNFIPASGALARRDAVLAAGGYDMSRGFAEDLDMWLRLLGHGTGLVVADVGCLWHQHAGQKSRRPAAAATQRAVIEAYAAERWWSPGLVEARLAVRAWDDARAALRGGQRRDVVRRLFWIAARPGRMRAVTTIWRWRLTYRRGARAVARDGGPRVHVLRGARPPGDAGVRPADAVVDRRGAPLWRTALHWLRHGAPEAAAGASAGQRSTCRLLGVRWLGGAPDRWRPR